MNREMMYDIVGLSYRAAPRETVLLVISNLISGLLPMAEYMAIKSFVDSVIGISSWSEWGKIIPVTLILFAVMILVRFMRSWFKIQEEFRRIKTENYIRKQTVRNFAESDYRFVEDDSVYGKLDRVSNRLIFNYHEGFTSILRLISLVLRIGSVIMILYSVLGDRSLFIIAGVILTCVVAAANSRMAFGILVDNTEDLRKMDYLVEMLTKREFAAERNLFRFSGRYQEVYRKHNISNQRKVFRGNLIGYNRMSLVASMMILCSGYTLYILTGDAVLGRVTMGTIASVLNVLVQLAVSLTWDLMGIVFSIVMMPEFLREYHEIRNLQKTEGALSERDTVKIPEKVSSISVRNLTFRYPTGSQDALKDIDLELKDGRTYAIVGRNGSGKSTLVKLISGLYRDYEGEILIDGRNIKDISLDDIRNTYSVMYQDFARYPVSMKDNVRMGDWSRELDVKKYIGIGEKVGLRKVTEELKNGDDSVLGKLDETSTDLSGGQWQRIAMARSLYNPSPVRIYDEPTAAMDPISESEFFETLHMISRGSLSIYITHRLASTQLADEIIVMDEGRIVEKGSHEELMDRKGLYHALYEDQRRWYHNGEYNEEEEFADTEVTF